MTLAFEQGPTWKVAHYKAGKWSLYELPPELFSAASGSSIISCIDENRLIYKNCPLPRFAKTKEAIAFAVEEHLPCAIDELLLRPLGTGGLLLLPKEALTEHRNIMERYGVSPHCVSCTPVALLGFCRLHNRQNGTILHRSAQGTSLTLIQNNALQGFYFTALQPEHPFWEREVRRLLHKRPAESPLILTGLPLLADLPCAPPCDLEIPEEERSFAVPIGLLSLSQKTPLQQVNFLEEQALLHALQSFLRPHLKRYFALSLLLAALTFFWSQTSQNALKGRIAAQTTTLRSPGPEYPYALANPLPTVHQVVDSLNHLPTEGIELLGFTYRLAQFPSKETPQAKFEGQIKLRVRAEQLNVVQSFCRLLEKEAGWIKGAVECQGSAPEFTLTLSLK